MRFVHDHPILCLNILFVVAGAGAAVLTDLIYRIACVVIVLALRALWAQAALKRACRRSAQDTARGILHHAEYGDPTD
jgi:hypothetical protein